MNTCGTLNRAALVLMEKAAGHQALNAARPDSLKVVVRVCLLETMLLRPGFACLTATLAFDWKLSICMKADWFRSNQGFLQMIGC